MLNPAAWTWPEWKAAGRHAASYAAGAVTAAAVIGLVSQPDAATLQQGLEQITTGVEQVAKGVAAIVGVLIPIYTALRAKQSAEPASQARSVADTLSGSSMPADAKREVIGAVAALPEVRGVITTTAALATAIPGPKVVASAADLGPHAA